MTTLPTPYAPSYTTSRADDDTLHMPLPTVDRTDRALDRRPAAQVLDATRLWTGVLATAAVAALVALVGTLLIRVLFEYAPVGTAAVRAFTSTSAGLLYLFAAVAALAALASPTCWRSPPPTRCPTSAGSSASAPPPPWSPRCWAGRRSPPPSPSRWSTS